MNTSDTGSIDSDYGSPGITHSVRVKNDLSSIDKIHDDDRNKLLVTTGKQHLALYKILAEDAAEDSSYRPSFINKPKKKQLQNIILMKDLLHNVSSGSGILGNMSNDSFSNISNNFSVSIPESLLNNSAVNHGSISPAGSFKFLNKGLNSNHISQSPSSSSLHQQLPHLTLQSRKSSTSSVKMKTFATNSDVKSGYKAFNHLVAVTNTSTTVSLYDINRMNTSSLFATIQEHTRTINSVDFHPQNAHSFIAGDMNGVAKIYDLRKLLSSTTQPSSSSISQLNHKTLSDMTITTQQNDAIRDIKWNPSSPNIFATIHDSGTILKYDIRYTAIPEKKISAHDGPGLCIHWIPSQNHHAHSQFNHSFSNQTSSSNTGSETMDSDYLASGGRDGKLCYWYMGDARPSLGIPERTVVVGGGIHKLKFRPTSSTNKKSYMAKASHAWNTKQESNFSLDETQVAISTNQQQMNNSITVYSPSRIYMPHHILGTRASSTGFVWFDEDHIFNIDKRNCINGFDLTKEPLMEENLGGKGLQWRDIEGDGLVFGIPIGVSSRYLNLAKDIKSDDIGEEECEDDATIEPTEKKVGSRIETEEKRSGSLSLFDKSLSNSPASSFLKHRTSLMRPTSTGKSGSPIEPSFQSNAINNSHNSFLMNLKRQKKKQQQETKSHSYSNSPIDRGTSYSHNTPSNSPFQQLVNSHSNWNSVTSHNSQLSQNQSIATTEYSKASSFDLSSQRMVYALNIPLIFDKIVPSNEQTFSENTSSKVFNNSFEKMDASPLEKFKFLAKNLTYANIEFISQPQPLSLTNNIALEKEERLEREKIINDLGFHDDWIATAETHTMLQSHCSGSTNNVTKDAEIHEKEVSKEEDACKHTSKNFNNTEAEVKVSVADYERLLETCKKNADLYLRVNDLSKCKLWNLIGKSISFHISELKKKYEKEEELEDAVSGSDHRNNSNDEAIIDDDDDANFYESNTDLESQSSLSKSSSFISNLKHRASSSNYYGNKYRESLVPVKYTETDDEEKVVPVSHKHQRIDVSLMTELQSVLLLYNKPWSLNNLLPYLFKQSQKTGDMLTASMLLLNFQQLVPLVSKANLKSAIYDFICILHTYELFEVSAQLLKSCYFAKDILSLNSDYNKEMNDDSKLNKANSHESTTDDIAPGSMIMIDQTKLKRTCIFCEAKVSKNTILLLKCGHIGHTQCLSDWFSTMGSLCPGGCIGQLI